MAKEEKMPSTGLTLAGAKAYLVKNFAKHTLKKTSELYFGLDVWDVKVLEDMPNVNSMRKRNFRLYTQGIDDEAKAYWEATQGPMSPPTPPTPELTFVSRLEAYIKTKVDDGTIKFGFIVQVSELSNKAICNVIMPDRTDKSILVSEDAEGVFSFELLG